MPESKYAEKHRHSPDCRTPGCGGTGQRIMKIEDIVGWFCQTCVNLYSKDPAA